MNTFSYLKTPLQFVMKLGNFLSHEMNLDGYTVEEINNLDRVKIAEEFKRIVYHSLLDGSEAVGNKTFLTDIALYVDEKLPKVYVKKKNLDKYGGKGLKEISNKVVSEYGLTQHGIERIKKIVYADEYFVEGYISNYKNKEEKQTEEVCTVKKRPSSYPYEKVNNYDVLSAYLRGNGIQVSNDEFRAILRTMNDLDTKDLPKSIIVKQHSQILNVPQSRINKHLTQMKFVRKVKPAGNKAFLKNQMIGMKQLSKRLEREPD